MTTKMDDMKQEYNEQIIKYKSDVDALNVDNDRLRGIVQKQNHEIENMKKLSKCRKRSPSIPRPDQIGANSILGKRI